MICSFEEYCVILNSEEFWTFIESSLIKRFAFEGEMYLILSLDFIYDVSVAFFLVKFIKLGFLDNDFGDKNLLLGGEAKIFDFYMRDYSEFIMISKNFQ